MKKLLSLSVLIAILWGCCSVEDTPRTAEKEKTITYTVTFDANGGSGEMGSQTFTYDVEQALTANTFTREDCTFAGWATTANGDVTYADEQKVSNLTAEDKATVTLFAVWNENDKVLPVIFSVASETAVDYGDSVTLSCDTEGVKISYTIDGVTAEYTDAIVITKDVTITAFATKDGMKKSDTTTASYTVKTYTVTYKSDYGTVPSKIVGLKKGDTLIEAQLPELTTDGYTFAGWFNGESEVTTEYKIICDLELSAKWTANTYTVKFNANGGIGETADMSFNYDEEKALTKNAFTRKDYTFAGWAVKADGNATYTDMAKVKNLTAEDKATVTLYAVWNENDKVLPVIFSVPSETAVDYGDSVTLSCATEGAKISYTIVDETVEYTDAITITKDVTITAFATKDGMKDSDESTASYTVKTYTVTYNSEHGTAPSDVAGLKKGDKLTAEQLPKLTTDGYTFAGWYNGENEVTTEYKISSDLNLTAKWNADTDTAYTVEHYQQNIADDEYILAETDTETGTTDEDTSATAKDYAGFTAKTIEQMKIAADGSTVVKIYYDRNTITLTLNLDGGEGKTEITGKYGADVTTPANPTKIGYTFAGWNPSLPATFPAENAEYTATWTAVTYTITYELNGGANVTSNPASYTIETETITLSDASKDGYIFAGWYDENGDKVTQIPSDTAKDINVTAKWWYSVNFVYVQGATITGAITGSGYTTSKIFIADKTVTVGDFYMCDHEVTQAEYEKYCSYGGSSPSSTYGDGNNYPAYYVSWYDALVYCNKRSMDEGLTPCYTINGSTNPTDWGSVPTSSDSSNIDKWKAATCDFTANGYRLPKEAEWEYAARGGNGLAGYQYEYAGSDTIGDVAWYKDNSGSKTHEVKDKKANGLGLYDMTGNVWEWCWDSYDSGSRYIRGGSWRYSADNCTVSSRDYYNAYGRNYYYGFRVVRTAE